MAYKALRIAEIKEVLSPIPDGRYGTGKTSLTYQDLLDAELHDMCCVVNDSKGGEMIARFYRPERGDIILIPTDDRCAYWNISSEGYDLATYKTVMTVVVSAADGAGSTADIFNQWTVSLGAYLLDQFRPDTETLGAGLPTTPRSSGGSKARSTSTPFRPTRPSSGLGSRNAGAGRGSAVDDAFCERRSPRVLHPRPGRETPQDGCSFHSDLRHARCAEAADFDVDGPVSFLGLLSSDTKKRTKLVYDELHTLQTLTRFTTALLCCVRPVTRSSPAFRTRSN